MKSDRRDRCATSMARSALTALSIVMVSVLAVASLTDTGRAASGVPHQYQYRVRHAVFGDIGTYTNTIESMGDTTLVRTNVHLHVTALGVVLRRESADRTERWRGKILREFHGVTTVNGVASKVDGRADGDAFVIVSPHGRVIAPATIRPSNPWSSDFLHSTSMMLTDSGAVERVRVSGGDAALVTVNGSDIWTRKYQIDGSLRYKIWIDQHNVPVAFAVDDDSGEVSFNLVR